MTATDQWIFLCAAHKQPRECSAIDYTRHTLDGAACLLNSNKYFPSRLVKIRRKLSDDCRLQVENTSPRLSVITRLAGITSVYVPVCISHMPPFRRVHTIFSFFHFSSENLSSSWMIWSFYMLRFHWKRGFDIFRTMIFVCVWLREMDMENSLDRPRIAKASRVGSCAWCPWLSSGLCPNHRHMQVFCLASDAKSIKTHALKPPALSRSKQGIGRFEWLHWRTNIAYKRG